MAFSMAGGGPSNPEINVTPLIDVLLVLIIVFMVVVSMAKEQGLEVQIPQPPKDREHPLTIDSTIVIQVLEATPDQSPGLKINQENVSWENLRGRLHDIFKLRAQRIAFVRGDSQIDFQYVADVIDIAHNAGVERVGLLSSQE